jgi:hypothetical protein
MNLIAESYSAIRWMFRLLWIFVRRQPLITLTTVGCAALSRITNVLAFFLPLKVILLAGAQGVPKHFNFIDPAHKLDWIIWLSVAAVATYILNIFLDVVSERLAERGSAGVLEGANKLALIGKQRTQARASFAKATQAASAGAFALVGVGVLAYSDARMCAGLLGLCVLELLVTAAIMAGWRAGHPGKLQGFIHDSPADYLRILSSLNFLASFFLILTPFVFSKDGNILLALLAVVIIRRTLPALVTTVRLAGDLYQERQTIDPLILRGLQLREQESLESQVTREFFSKTARHELVERHLLPLRPGLGGFEVHWQDSPIKGAFTFIVSCASVKTGERQLFQQQVFPFKQAYLLEHEDFLFSLVKREQLNAPPAIARFREGSFECQICEYGEEVTEQEYPAALAALLADAWCFKPPKKLVTVFKAAHASLPGRLTPDIVERLAVACDSPVETATFETLRSRLAEISARLEALPLQVFNPDIEEDCMTRFASGEVRIISWTHWAIEPVGVGIPEELSRDGLQGLVDRLNSRRTELTSAVTLQDIRLADACWQFEQKLSHGKYKAALRKAAQVMTCLNA